LFLYRFGSYMWKYHVEVDETANQAAAPPFGSKARMPGLARVED
jgi:hypothetical protein